VCRNSALLLCRTKTAPSIIAWQDPFTGPTASKTKTGNTKMNIILKFKYAAGLTFAAVAFLTARTAFADDLTNDSRRALHQLVAQNPAAAQANSKALAVLVFPTVVKAGFVVGAQGGKGVLFMHGQPSGRYRTVAASYGLQAGVQKYGYALFLMNQKAVDWVNNTRGWEIGTGPSVVIVDKGMARSFNTNTLHSGIYAFTFDQQGLMAGLGLQGSKIMRLD
jgi:lipid-binding SYLF domain-containing protein